MHARFVSGPFCVVSFRLDTALSRAWMSIGYADGMSLLLWVQPLRSEHDAGALLALPSCWALDFNVP